MPQKKDETSRKRANQLREAITHAILYKWLKDAGVPTVHVTKSRHQGATDAIIFEADVKIKFHVKDSLHDAPKEREGFNILKKQWGKYKSHLAPPLFEDLEGLNTIILVPYQNAITLHRLIAEQKANDDWIKKVYEDFLNTSKTLWVSSKLLQACNLAEIYKERIMKRIDRLKAGLKKDQIHDLKVSINGKSYGTLGDSISEFSTSLDKLRVDHSCTIHGDEHANNIMVHTNAIGIDPTGWVMIDYVNARKDGDWIFSIAKMLQWWKFYYVLELAKSKSKVKKELQSSWKIQGDTLQLNYSEEALHRYTPNICSELETKIMEFAHEVGTEFQENPADWEKRLRLALFSVIFGSMPLHLQRDDFAVPIMIHKSLEFLDNP